MCRYYNTHNIHFIAHNIRRVIHELLFPYFIYTVVVCLRLLPMCHLSYNLKRLAVYIENRNFFIKQSTIGGKCEKASLRAKTFRSTVWINVAAQSIFCLFSHIAYIRQCFRDFCFSNLTYMYKLIHLHTHKWNKILKTHHHGPLSTFTPMMREK